MDPSEYLSFVKEIVNRNYTIYSYAKISKDELISAGLLGLTKALNKFNKDKNASFKTYASIRVLGEIKDFLRTIPSQNSRNKSKRIVEINVDFNNNISTSLEYNEEALINRLKLRCKGILSLSYKRHIEGQSLERLAKDEAITASRMCQIFKEHNLNEKFKELVKEELGV